MMYYQQQYPQYPQYQMPQAAQQPQQQQQGIIWVQGESGAKSYIVAPGQSVLLMDSEKSAFYIKSTDISGMPLPLRIFDYTERNGTQPAPAPQTINFDNYITRDEFERVISQLTNKNTTEDDKNAKSNL